MSLTANFDYCAELGIDLVREIFHLAFKAEDRYPHNVGPFERNLSGQAITVWVRVLDDNTDMADLSFPDPLHVLFSFPFELRVETPGAPDPALSRITIKARIEAPALISAWPEGDADVLGLSFETVTADAITIVALDGLPTIDASRFAAAIHTKYASIPHVYAQGGGTLVLYDGNRDPSLAPPNAATPAEIQVALENQGGEQYLKVIAPVHASVPVAGNFAAYGRITFWRKVTNASATVTVDMTAVPALPIPQTTVNFDSAHPARIIVETQLQPLIDPVLGAYGVLIEPGFDEAGAKALLADEVAKYLVIRRFPLYSPAPLADGTQLGTPVGFTLGGSVFAVLLNRRSGTSADDHPPDDFLGGSPMALAVGRAKVDEHIAEAIAAEFPGLASGGHLIEVPEGSATLQTLSVVPANPGEHDVDQGHLWVSGTAEVHIDCWPDPDISFEGPIFLTAQTGEDPDGGCSFTIKATPGDFDIDQSCCDVFLDLITPIVGWIMLAIVESTIDAVGGELVKDIGERQARHVEAFPPVVNGIAEISTCVTGLRISAQGFVFPAQANIRRLGESFEDRAADHDLPRP